MTTNNSTQYGNISSGGPENAVTPAFDARIRAKTAQYTADGADSNGDYVRLCTLPENAVPLAVIAVTDSTNGLKIEIYDDDSESNQLLEETALLNGGSSVIKGFMDTYAGQQLSSDTNLVAKESTSNLGDGDILYVTVLYVV